MRNRTLVKWQGNCRIQDAIELDTAVASTVVVDLAAREKFKRSDQAVEASYVKVLVEVLVHLTMGNQIRSRALTNTSKLNR